MLLTYFQGSLCHHHGTNIKIKEGIESFMSNVSSSDKKIGWFYENTS